jgi:hypothetical protein
VYQAARTLSNYEDGARRYAGGIAGDAQGIWAPYRLRLQQGAAACMARTFTAAENATAGCGTHDSPASCERKLFDWCMNRPMLKQLRDAYVKQLQNQILHLQGLIQATIPSIYPAQ